MSKPLSIEKITEIIELMTMKDEKGNYLFGQRELERQIDVSRVTIRKIAKSIGHQFPRNGIEVKGMLCMCTNCGFMFRKPPSRVIRAEKQFCDDECRMAYQKGANHPSWKHGKSANTFSSWVKNQAEYKRWREAVLERDGYQCQVSGLTEQLEAHHLLQKADMFNPERVFDVDNGMTLAKPVHTRLHQLMSQGLDIDAAFDVCRKEFAQKEEA